jgi:hypothetical protein
MSELEQIFKDALKENKVREMSEKERKDIINSMSDNFTSQDDPKVGIFWYLPEEDELFGVNKINAEEIQFNSNGIKTISVLHKNWWQKQKNRLISKNKELGIFNKDYTDIPRGRVFQRKDGIFQLMCGSWITDDIEEMIKEEFDLQNVPYERIIDEHWEIGHGWSEEFQA